MLDIVIGAGFGDEGKGYTVNRLASINPTDFVVRFNGGHQAGHTVSHNGIKHVFSNFGSGTLAGIPTYWSKFCTVDIIGLRKEFNALTNRGIVPELYIDPLAMVTLPMDKFSNLMNDVHGTVGVGFGETVKRHESFFKLHAADLLNENVLKNKLHLILSNYYKDLNFTETLTKFLDDLAWLKNCLSIKIERPKLKGNIIFEGAQGILLDQDFGFFPHVTRSKCTPVNALALIKEFNLDGPLSVYYVSRTYHTRHGKGPFVKYAEDLKLKEGVAENETNQFNPYQGHFRTALLDVDLLTHAIRCSMLESPMTGKALVHFTCEGHHDGPILANFGGFIAETTVEELGAHLEKELKNYS